MNGGLWIAGRRSRLGVGVAAHAAGMCWQCDNPDRTLDDYLAVLRSTIAARGWVVQYVEDDRRPYAYTIGLHGRGQPELLVSGLGPRTAQWLLNTFARRFSNRRPSAGDRYSLPARTRVEIVDVEHPDAHMNMAVALEGRDIAALQLVWADGRGRFPWAPEFDDGKRIQPVLGRRASQAGGPNA